ncbi:MAG: glycosyltransferase [Acidobacteriota bacterium]
MNSKQSQEVGIKEMIHREDIICFANDWDGDPLSKKHIMMRLAKYNRVLWVNSLGNRNPTISSRDLQRICKKIYAFASGLQRVHENIWVFTPLVVPLPGLRLARIFNEHLLRASIRLHCRRLGFSHPITWTFVPSSADVVGRLGEKLVLYHCVDEYSQFSDTNRTMIANIEEKLLRKSDVVIVSAAKLFESKQAINANTYLMRHGVDFEHFARACLDTLEIPPDIGCLPRPIIGFHGLIADWVDMALIERCAQAHPEWSIVLLGKSHDGIRINKRLKNIHWLGGKDYRDLPAYCKAFDVAIIPFVVNELTINANPLKLREYLAAGLPVVSTDIPEAYVFNNLIAIGRNQEEFIHQIELVLANRAPGPNIARSLQMRSESWDARVEELSTLIQHHLKVKCHAAAKQAA